MATRITASFLWRKWHQGVSAWRREGEGEGHVGGVQALCLLFFFCFRNARFRSVLGFPLFRHPGLWTFQRSRCFFSDPRGEKVKQQIKKKKREREKKKKRHMSHLLQALRFTLQPIWRAKSQTVTAGSPVWLHWEGHNLSSVPACSRANTARRATGAPASTSCLCWPTVTLHPSEVTPAPLHKVNLPLKIWYLLTCLIECDGCLTFIEFFYKWV